jgi:TRAP-type C4-dicarboxylate transport system permease small subunit
MSAQAKLEQVGEIISRTCTVIAAASLAVIVCINAANVFCRYFFLAPFHWAEELMLFLMILTVFAGAASVTWRQEHIRIEAFFMRFTPKWQTAALILGGLVALTALGTVIATGSSVISMLFRFDQRSEALEFPMWIAQISVPTGLGLIIFLFLLRAYVSLGQSDRPHTHGETL